MIRIAFQDRHNEDKALEVSKREYLINFEMPALVARQWESVRGRRERK